MIRDQINLTGSEVLIVDDVPENLSLLRQALESEGYQISVAPSGMVALKIVSHTKPDLILLDIVMPEIDGFEVCRRLKQDEATADIPIIFITAKDETESVVEGLKVGAVDYITKPFQTEEVLVRVRTHLAMSRLTQELVRSEATLQLTMAQMPAVLWTTDTQLRFTSSVGAGLSALNLQPNQVVGQTLYEFFQTRDAAFPAIAVHRRVLAGESVIYEQEWAERVYQTYVEPLRNMENHIIGCIGIALDITHRRQAEKALQESEASERHFRKQLTALISVSNDLSKVHSSDELCWLAVALGRLRLGFDRLAIWFRSAEANTIVGSFGTDEHGVLRDERSQRVAINDSVKEILQSQTPITRCWHDSPLSDDKGNIVAKGTKAAAAIWDGAEILGFISLDNLLSREPITDRDCECLSLYASIFGHMYSRKRAEEEILRANEKAKEAAEAASHAKSMFLANMSHELRTPLHAILGYSQILSRNPDLPSDVRRAVEVISSSGNHLLTLINETLDLSKIEAGRIELQPIDFDLVAFILDLSAMFQLRCQQKGLDWTVEWQPPSLSPPVASPKGPCRGAACCARHGAPTAAQSGEMQRGAGAPTLVHGDEGKLKQVLINLLSNAIKFTRAGSVTLRITHVPAPSLYTYTFEVIDTGIGFSPEEQTQILEPFERGSAGTTTEGTGLGLPIAQGYVQLMGGQLVFESEPGVGSRFEVRLPLAPAQRVVAAQKDSLSEITLPEDLFRRLKAAAEVSGFSRLKSLLKEVETITPGGNQLAAYLRRLIDNFEMNEILAALGEIQHE
ncbi:MAG: response regulator [Candidatus Poribacteria bacterium]|nr:response regulator [Candidatus Poribacteria bacterium]